MGVSETTRGPGVRQCKPRQAFAEDGTRAAGLAAEEPAGGDPEDDAASTDRQVGEGAVVPAVDPLGRLATRGAVGGRGRRSQGEDDQVRGEERVGQGKVTWEGEEVGLRHVGWSRGDGGYGDLPFYRPSFTKSADESKFGAG
jgi:hypothetical protein